MQSTFKAASLLAVLGLFFVPASACSSDPPPATDDTGIPKTELSPNLTQLTSEQVDAAIDVQQDRLVFASSEAWLLNKHPGEILLGASGPKHFARKIVTIAPSASGIVVTTEPAQLNEIFLRGGFDTSLSFLTPDATIRNTVGGTLVPLTESATVGPDSVKVSLGDGRRIELKDIDVNLSRANVEIHPGIRTRVVIDWNKFSELLVVGDLDVKTELALKVHAKLALNQSVSQNILKVPYEFFFTVPAPIPIPVWGTVMFNVDVGLNTELSQTYEGEPGFLASGHTSAGIHYKDGRIHLIGEQQLQAKAIDTTWNVESTAKLKASLTPTFRVNFYDIPATELNVAGLYVGVRPSATVEVTDTKCHLFSDIDGFAGISSGFLKTLSTELHVEFPTGYEKNLFSLHQEIAACPAPTCTNECPVAGALDCASPTGVRTCNAGAKGCLAWSTETSCPAAQSCQAGQCNPKVCNANVDCPSGFTCRANQCKPDVACSNANGCTASGQIQCSGSGAFKVCGDYDSNGCLELSAQAQSCPSSAPVCSQNACQTQVVTARCGDGSCNNGETCSSCSQDCGVCAARCGDGACNSGETCSSCSQDCGVCAPRCGDGVCNNGETCSSCSQDCGACAPRCGDRVCNGNENCSTCASDCGACQNQCSPGQIQCLFGSNYQTCVQVNGAWVWSSLLSQCVTGGICQGNPAKCVQSTPSASCTGINACGSGLSCCANNTCAGLNNGQCCIVSGQSNRGNSLNCCSGDADGAGRCF